MHPAPSVIIFTVLSGLGFGFLACLAAGLLPVAGAGAVATWGLGYALAVGGLLSSTFHLGNPQRALLAFTQWRTSWLSREGWAAVLTLLLLAPVAVSDVLGGGWPRWIGVLGAAGCAVTVACTAMIYAQLRTVPRWNHWITPALFLAFAVTGGAILSGRPSAVFFSLGLAGLVILSFVIGDGQFARRASTMASATGLGGIGAVSVFEHPHTGGNYLMREMIHVVGRRHAARLRVIACVLLALPAVILPVMPLHLGIALAALCHLGGAFAARWLFFAQAEHVVGLYYGARG